MKLSEEQFKKLFDELGYVSDDFARISWADFDTIMDKITGEVADFLEKSNLSVKYMVPILRGAAIPAVVLAHRLSVIDFMPVQVKCLGRGRTAMLFDPSNIDMAAPSENECVIVVEDNQCFGGTANKAMDIVRKKFGETVKIIYVRLLVDYSCQDRVPGTVFTSTGLLTNEMGTLAADECDACGVAIKKLGCFPWETPQEELKQMAINRARP